MRRVTAVAALALVALVAAALLPGPHGTAVPRFGVARIARLASPVHPQGSHLMPLPGAAFAGPIKRYRVYAEHWNAHLASAAVSLQAALVEGSRNAAKREWERAFADYLHLGPVRGLLPAALMRRLAGMPPTSGGRDFTGLHRIERGLWTDASLRRLVPVATDLQRAIARAQRLLPRVRITPLAYGRRAHEILQDARRDLLNGVQVPWSGEGLLGTAAAVATTREVVLTLTPLLQGRGGTLDEIQNWLLTLQQATDGVRRRDGAWPTLGQLSRFQLGRLDETLSGALSAVALIPGILEGSTVAASP